MSIFKKIGEKLVGTEGLIIWERDESDGVRNLVYRIPNIKIPDMRKVEKFGVRDFERVLIFNSGRLTSILEGGVYEIEKNHRNSATEIVYVDNGVFDLRWGIPFFQESIKTSEFINIGMNGSLKLKVIDHPAFIEKVVAFKKDFTDQVVNDFITSLLVTSLRDIVKKYTLRNFIQANREDIKALTVTKVSQEFKIYGLELISIDILGYTFDPKYQSDIDDILSEDLKDIAKFREEKNRLEGEITDFKRQKTQLQKDAVSSLIELEEMKNKVDMINTFIQSLELDLKDVQSKIDDITKRRGIQN